MATVESIAAELTKLTGDKWTGEAGNNANYFYLIRSRDSLNLGVFKDYQNKGDISLDISAKTYREAVHYDENAPKIGISWFTRDANSVAKDIVRRLLNEAEKFNKVLNERVAKNNAYENKTKATQAALGLEFHNDTASFMPENKNAWARAIRVSGDLVNMELSSLTETQALIILQVLKLETVEEVREYMRDI